MSYLQSPNSFGFKNKLCMAHAKERTPGGSSLRVVLLETKRTQPTRLHQRRAGCWPISRHPPGEDNTSPGLPESLGRRFLLLRFGYFRLGSGLRFSGAGACRTPPETSHKSVPPLLPEAWNAFSFCIRRHHSFPSIWSLLKANRLENS